MRTARYLLASLAVPLPTAMLFLAGGCGSTQADAVTKDSGVHDAAKTEEAAGDAGAMSDALSDAQDGGTTRTLITEPDQGMTPIYDFINSAKKSIDMTMYDLVDTTVTGYLTAAAKNGVTVRVILDTNLEGRDNTPAYDALNAGGCQAHWADTTYAATHQKTITVDQKTTAVMSINLASEYYATSRDFAVITNDPNDVAAVETTFEADFNSTAITPPNGDDLVWSPTTAEADLVGLLNGAKSSIILENEEMSDSDIVGALNGAAQRGVSVKVVMTNSRSWASDFATLAQGGVKIATYAESASLYIHAKVILVDSGQAGAKFFVGSENFSISSLTKNRELGLISTDPAILSSLETTLTKDFAGGTLYSSD